MPVRTRKRRLKPGASSSTAPLPIGSVSSGVAPSDSKRSTNENDDDDLDRTCLSSGRDHVGSQSSINNDDVRVAAKRSKLQFPCSSFGCSSRDQVTDEAIPYLSTCIAAGPRFHHAAIAMLQAVAGVSEKCFTDFKSEAHFFGSYVQGTCTVHSDVDICINAGEGKIQKKRVVKLLQRLESYIRRAGASESLQIVETVYEASVPILRLRKTIHEAESESSIEADVSVGDGQACYDCDSVLRRLLSENNVAHNLVLLIKHWARQHSFNKAFLGFLSSFSWVLLTVFYLQRIKVLPSCPQPCPALAPLLQDFFLFLREPALISHGISVARGGVFIDRPARAEGRARGDAPLFVEVPLFPRQNAARSLRPECWKQILKEADAAKNMLKTHSGTKGSLQALMEKSIVDRKANVA